MSADLQRTHQFLRSKLQPGLTVDGADGVLPKLEWKQRPFVAPIMVYTELRRPIYVRQMGVRPVLSTLELSNKVVIYRSNGFTEFAGTRGMVLLQQGDGVAGNRVGRMDEQEKAIVARWWDFLTEFNPLFHAYGPGPGPGDGGEGGAEAGEEVGDGMGGGIAEIFHAAQQENVPQEPVSYIVPAADVGPYVVGPWMDSMGIVVGVDVLSQQEITLKNPNLFGLMFPWLYPFGEGFFSLKMAKTNLRDRLSAEEQAWPVVTIKNFSKLAMGMSDRRFGQDLQFVCFLYDMLLKERYYSSAMRTVNPSAGGRPTTAADVFGKARYVPLTKQKV
ncbi:MAG: hypothetical protein JOS17DRAFT_808718 [Linnemannia elongata]|nr:MAG: hypothetical protein JOS17DRAFT_808718 [Linnemannia elongata]